MTHSFPPRRSSDLEACAVRRLRGVFRRLLVDQRAAKRRPAIALGRYAGKRVFHVAERLQHRRAIRLIGLFTILAPDTHVGLALPPIEQRETTIGSEPCRESVCQDG